MKFVVCISNQDYPAALEVRKLYQVLEDAPAQQRQMLRIIDESGEDYLSESLQQVFAAVS
ncbi:MAG: hypothetical protein AAF827_19430 [Cyanobacteria bacterium P01_D01_bin.6]